MSKTGKYTGRKAFILADEFIPLQGITWSYNGIVSKMKGGVGFLKELVLGIQYASIIALFVECWVVLKNWKEKVHSYLFFTCVANLVNNIGYLLELKSHSQEAYLTAAQLSYVGRTWISFALLLFIAQLVKIQIPYYLKSFLALVHVAIYLSVLTTTQTGLYYSNIQFVSDGVVPSLRFHPGMMHDLLTVLLILYMAAGIAMLVVSRRREDNPVFRKCLLMVLLAVITEGGFAMVQMFKLGSLAKVYDVTMLGYPIGTAFMFLAIFRYRLLDTETLAREYVIDELSEGVIAVDGQGKPIFFNKPALDLLPELLSDPQDVTAMLQRLIDGESCFCGRIKFILHKRIIFIKRNPYRERFFL